MILNIKNTKKYFYGLCSLLVFHLLPFRAVADQDFDPVEWMANFYVKRDIVEFDKYWNGYVVKGAFEANHRVGMSTIGFLSQIFNRNPDLLKKYIQNIDQFPETQRNAVKLMLWWTNTPYAQLLLEKSGDFEILKIKPVQIDQIVVDHRENVSFFIGCFFAKGDISVLKPLVGVLRREHLDEEDGLVVEVVSELRSLCRKDKNVAAYIKTVLSERGLGENSKAAIELIVGE